MSEFNNPALAAFVREFGHGRVFGLIVIRRVGDGWELRHAKDHGKASSDLRQIDLPELRRVAQYTATGAYRPLKAAPNLSRGWRLPIMKLAELGEALERLHPGAVSDWFAATNGSAKVTDYRTFTGRQTGMYRITTFLDDEQASDVARACCHASCCVKRRLWSAGKLPSDDDPAKSLIPCLEPCALFLELARTIARLTKDDAIPLPVDAQAMKASLRDIEAALAQTDSTVREADFAAPENRRRLLWLREKLARMVIEADLPAP